MSPARRFATFILLILGALLVVTVAFSLLIRRPSETFKQAVTAPTSFASAVPFDATSLVLSNGRSFVKYDISSGKSALLSTDATVNALSSIDSLAVSADKTHLLFHAGSNAAGGVLAARLQAQGLDAAKDYWWLYDISAQSFKALPTGILLAAFSGQDVKALAYSGGQEFITTYTQRDGGQISHISVNPSSSFLAAADGYLLLTAKNDVLYTKDGIVNQTILSNGELIASTKDGSSALLVQTVNNDRSLVRYDVRTGKLHKLAGGVVGNPALTADDSTVFYASQDKADQPVIFHRVHLSGGKVTNLNLKAVDANDVSSLTLGQAVSPEVVLAGMGGTQLLIGNDVHALSTLMPSYVVNFTDASGSHAMGYNIAESALQISFNGSVETEQAAAYARLRSDGYDPLLQQIFYSQATPDAIVD